jgi:GR25 family glycosyltransferase involved in LPS biosynthesis
MALADWKSITTDLYYSINKILHLQDSLFAIHFSTPLLCNRLPSEKNVLNKYQIILISTSVERKNKIIEQFNELNIHAQLICFENPSIVTNSTDYFPENIFESDKNIVCCTRDHIRALELSTKDESPEFSIIIEDDVAFHKTKFIDGINEIMNNWAKITEPTSAKMVSIGLVPSCKYDDYSKQSPKYTLESIQDSKILGDIYEIGTTAYIVRKCDMKTQTALFGHNTLDSLRNTINLMKRNGLETVDCISGDYFINKALNQVFVFPPLVIEQDIKTALCDDMRYWINLYYGREDYIKDFCSF